MRDCCRMRATRGAVIFSDALLWDVLWREGLVIPSPPRRTGSAMRSLFVSLNAAWPVRDGRNCCLIVSSSG